MADNEPRAGVVEKVIVFSGKNRWLVLAASIALAGAGAWSALHTPLDALPDLSDTQVIIATEWMGRNPTLIEDQITYPIVTSFLGAPKVKTVRGLSHCASQWPFTKAKPVPFRGLATAARFAEVT